MSRISVYGTGAWGTALAVAFSKNHSVTLWGRNVDQIAQISAVQENQSYLPGVSLATLQTLTANLAQAANEAVLHVIATPLSGLRPTLQALKPYLSAESSLIWACKGIDPQTAHLPHEIIAEILPGHLNCGVLTGPSFAAEVAAALPTALTLASAQGTFAQHWVAQLHQPRLRIYSSHDLVGAEVGGAVKNVIAIAAGISDGMGFGLNARAGLITRGLAETTRLARALGGQPQTLMGLSGMGDLILTCTGALSRNRKVGLELATGKKLTTILAELGHVAEGVPTAQAVISRAQALGVEMPICETVNALLYHNAPPGKAVEALLARDPRAEASL